MTNSKKFLIIHADDVGVSNVVNQSTFEAFHRGDITSCAIMVPCQEFASAAAYLSRHPQFDVGVHLTLTAEWSNHRWGPISPLHLVPSLVDEHGHFYKSVLDFMKHAKPHEVEIEGRAQIKKALESGLKLSHLDAHMYSLYFKTDLYEVYHKLALEFSLKFISCKSLPNFASHFTLQDLFMAEETAPQKNTLPFYLESLRKTKPGFSELLVHLGEETPELDQLMDYRKDWGASWRKLDTDILGSKDFKAALAEYQIELTDWRHLTS
jgi:predicted glycoside hydrolase/deacetylase ChbG (UPF0249 family)